MADLLAPILAFSISQRDDVEAQVFWMFAHFLGSTISWRELFLQSTSLSPCVQIDSTTVAAPPSLHSLPASKLFSPLELEQNVEPKVEQNVEPKVEPKVEQNVEPELELKIEHQYEFPASIKSSRVHSLKQQHSLRKLMELSSMFHPNQTGIHARLLIIHTLTRLLLPRLFEHLKEIQGDACTFVFKSLICFFKRECVPTLSEHEDASSTAFSFESIFILWVWMFEQRTAFIECLVAVTLMEKYEEDLLMCRSVEELIGVWNGVVIKAADLAWIEVSVSLICRRLQQIRSSFPSTTPPPPALPVEQPATIETTPSSSNPVVSNPNATLAPLTHGYWLWNQSWDEEVAEWSLVSLIEYPLTHQSTTSTSNLIWLSIPEFIDLVTGAP